MMKKLFILSIFLLLSNLTFAQYKSTKLKMADGLLEEGKLYAALQIYEDIAKGEGENKSIYRKIAELHEELYNFEEAAKWYYELFEIQDGEYPKSELKFAFLMKMQGKYKVALEHFYSFSKTYSGHDKFEYSKICKNEIKICKVALESLPNAEISIKKIPENINSNYTDLAPFTHNGKLYYSSIKSDSTLTYTGFLDSAPTFQIYMAEQIEDEKFDSSKLFIPEVLNTPYQHTSNGSFNSKGNQFFFTRCKENINGKTVCKIYCTSKNDSTWEKPVLLGPEINDRNNNFSSTHPVLMTYKKQGRSAAEINKLVFASSMPGGVGGYDLWSCTIGKELKCEKLENLGKKVNSFQDDLTPFYSSNEGHLYFSSNGHGGLGGLDIFKTQIKNGNPKKIKALDQPINSSSDDWYYNQMNAETAFIVSNRFGAKSYHNNTRIDDIFLIKKEKQKYLSLYAQENDSLAKQIHGGIFKIKLANDPKAIAKQVRSGEAFQVIPNKTYEITAQKNDYINESTLFSTSSDTKSDTLNWTFKLQKIDTITGFILKNIYFENNSFALKPESKQALNKMYRTLMDNPSFKVEIGAHTDNVGTDEYNYKLSTQRALEVVKYLIKKGIGSTKLIAKGYGKSQVITGTSDNAKNRRIVFKIIDLNHIDQQK
tara:strand:- start:1355 stop:3316 length:1962 start_codon:yes stop_codon:yes gene_type:complete